VRARLALQADGAGYCWGQNSYGQLGAGDLQDRPLPTRVLAAGAFGAIAPGGSLTSCGVLADGGLYMWGNVGFVVGWVTAPKPVYDNAGFSSQDEGQRFATQLGSMGWVP
jgi:alpha-tubulin suppressor-like RCC1 family protein